jgi:ferredoxin
MPAGPEEIEDALDEGVELMPLLSVVRLERDDDDSLVAAVTQRMRLDTPDETGRGRPVPVPGSERRLAIDSLIVAISQKPDLEGFDDFDSRGDWLLDRDGSITGAEVLAGGDVVGLGIAGNAIVQGRLAAERLHEGLRREKGKRDVQPMRLVQPDAVKFETRSTAPRAAARKISSFERLVFPDAEVAGGVTEKQFLAEVERCVSCGSCFGCAQCAMFCTAGCYRKLADGYPGNYFELSLAGCNECGKCIEVCPCGFLEIADV